MPPEKPIRILIAEDQSTIPRAFASVIDEEPEFELVAEAGDGAGAVQSARRHQPQIVLLDLQTPDLDGVVATRQILRDCPDAQVIILAALDRDDQVFDSICAGAQACLLANSDRREIVDTIRAVARGESRLAPGVARRLLDEFRRVRRKPPAGGNRVAASDDSLTQREKDILLLIVEGKGNKAIASALNLAEGTVKNYVSRIMEKSNARSRTELAVKALNRRGE